jgi:hypothetical protein
MIHHQTVRHIPIEGGEAQIGTHGCVTIRPYEPTSGARCGHAAWLTPEDLAQLLRMACGTDAEALKTLAYVMGKQHRFLDAEDERVPYEYDDDQPF